MTPRLGLLTTTILAFGLESLTPLEAAHLVQPPAPPPRLARTGGAAPANVVGTWAGSIRLDSAWRLPNRATARSTAARIRFEQVGVPSPTIMSSRSVHPGTFEIDFDRFGFSLATHDALGWTVGSDSMRAVLNPAVSHGAVELHGVVHGDTMAGRWRFVSDPGGATGTFFLRRVVGRDDSLVSKSQRARLGPSTGTLKKTRR